MAEILRCPRCSDENPADARFCIDCGTTLISATTGPTTRLATVACPGCRTNNPEQAHFCVLCGRSLSSRPSPQPQPALRPASPAVPHVAPPAQQSHPRVATPPALTTFRSTPAPMQPAQSRGQNPAPFIFIIGLVLLFANHMVWPGILMLIGVSMLIGHVAQGRPARDMRKLFWVIGLLVLFTTGSFFPGIFVLLLLNAIMNGWSGGRHHW